MDVEWEDAATGWRPQTSVRISYQGTVRQGTRDELRYTAVGDDVREKIFANRRITLLVTVDTNDANLDSNSGEIADDLAAGFERTDVAALLAAEGVYNVQPQSVRHVPYRADGNDWRTASVFELWLHTARGHTGALIPRVKAVEFSGEVDDGPDVGPVTVEES